MSAIRRMSRWLGALLVVAVAAGVGVVGVQRTARAQPAAPPAQRVSAPAQTAAGAIPSVTIVARNYSYDAPATFPAGIVSVTMRNEGPEPHHAQFFRLNDGVTLDQFGAALRAGPESALALVSAAGGPGTVMAGGSQEVILDLAVGDYVMLCFVSGDDGVPHVAKGMLRPFRVVPPVGSAAAPPADGDVTLFDFGFQLPATIHAGESTLRVTNEGPQPHEMSIVKVPADVTQAQIEAALSNLSGPPPFQTEDVGGLQAIAAGQTAWLKLNLTPGTYVALCFVPDAASGAPHAALGMAAPFTVP